METPRNIYKSLNLAREKLEKMIFDHEKIRQKERQAGQQRNGICDIGLSHFSPFFKGSPIQKRKALTFLLHEVLCTSLRFWRISFLHECIPEKQILIT